MKNSRGKISVKPRRKYTPYNETLTTSQESIGIFERLDNEPLYMGFVFSFFDLGRSAVKFYRSIATIVATCMSLFLLFPSPAEAKPARVPFNGQIVEVTENLPSSWDVQGAVSDVDWYTGANWKIVKDCSGKYNCVDIRQGAVAGKAVGKLHNCNVKVVYEGGVKKSSRWSCRVTIDVRDAATKKTYNSATKRWLIRHELSHRVLGHQKSCVSTMYEYTRCSNGKIPPYTYTSAEQSKLRKL